MKKYIEVELPILIFEENESEIIDWLYDNVSWESFSSTLTDQFKWYRYRKLVTLGNGCIAFWFLNSNEAMLFKLTWIGL